MHIEALGLVQAPMAGVSTLDLAAAVSAAGGLGSVALGALSADQAAAAMAGARARMPGGFAVNLFCHGPAQRDAAREAAWCARLAPEFARYGAAAPAALVAPYRSFREDDAMLRAVLAARPAVVSFHFGLPRPDQLAALRATGARLIATATCEAEAQAIAAAGLDGIVAQGWQAGGHRGCFDPGAADARLDTAALVVRLAGQGLPVIAAGGIMTAADRRAALAAGAAAVQCGTAFLRCPEAATSPAHRAALAAGETVMTRAISGRPARGMRNLWAGRDAAAAPDYPVAYDAGKALNAAALAVGEPGWGAHWAGTGAAQAKAQPAGDVLCALMA